MISFRYCLAIFQFFEKKTYFFQYNHLPLLSDTKSWGFWRGSLAKKLKKKKNQRMVPSYQEKLIHIIISKQKHQQKRKNMRNVSRPEFNSTYIGIPNFPPFLHHIAERSNFLWGNQRHYATSVFSPEEVFLRKLGADIIALSTSVHSNNKIIESAVNMLKKMEKSLQEAEQEVNEKISSQKKSPKEQPQKIIFSQPNQVPFFTNQPLIAKIFDQEKFRFKLHLEHKFPKIIYKDRKLTLKLRLVNPDGTPICNANLIHLCIGACNQEGQWILNEEGNLFIGGKIEVDLYHGDSEFKRVYPSDISRRYSAENIKIIVYPKRSLLKFTGELQKHQKEISPEDIQPLVISDVLVKAKKKT